MPSITDQTIYHWLRELQIVRSQYHVSELCGRSAGWFSSTRCQGRDMPVSAVLALVWHMEKKAEQETDKLAQERLRVMIARMREECTHRAVRKFGNKKSH
ncbi:hypothetical protein [Falsiroseomonas sp.]|uniref:hypothetical protein n=1 Tax=Falsiroseomonas sp. TaxID=2870721 RepID=UPI003F72C0BD